MFQEPKRLSILRHAKTEEGDGDDHARRLIERGIKDARRLGEHLATQRWLPELVVCSTAIRARQTLAELGATLPTIFSKRLYLASPGELLSFLQTMDDEVQHLLLIGHNPGLHGLVAALAEQYLNDQDAELLALKYPTCTYSSLQVDVTQWRSLAPHTATLDRLVVGNRL